MAALDVDRFDEIRRAWIAAHQGSSRIQRRRAEVLGRKVRTRQRARASAVPDPHDDTTVPPLWLRNSKSAASHIEALVVLVAAMVIPLGWLGGWLLKHAISQAIPRTLRGFPVAVLLWGGAVLGLLIIVLYHPELTFGDVVLMPWICLQVAAMPAVAGAYGVAEGWLAVPGSDQWWPLLPNQRAITADEAADILGGYDNTGPGLVDAQPLNTPGERTRL